MAAAWPARAGDPFADRMNEIDKYVASRTLSPDSLSWANSALLPPDDGRAHTLKLVASVTSKTGVNICTFRPVRDNTPT